MDTFSNEKFLLTDSCTSIFYAMEVKGDRQLFGYQHTFFCVYRIKKGIQDLNNLMISKLWQTFISKLLFL